MKKSIFLLEPGPDLEEYKKYAGPFVKLHEQTIDRIKGPDTEIVHKADVPQPHIHAALLNFPLTESSSMKKKEQNSSEEKTPFHRSLLHVSMCPCVHVSMCPQFPSE